ncbi:MAG: hypothetical protein M3O09_09480 [Acidobacteriota bacterium]|jgi:hypothetical protein|nr:hypothetical protein [Acidobacteriota bacterium]
MIKRQASIVAALLLVASFAPATTVIPLSLEKLTQVSTLVIEGNAVESWSQWNASHSFILTYTRFQVQRTLKGQTSSTIVVHQLGGKLDGITQKVAGVRIWGAGEQAVLFLRPGQFNDGSFVVTGLMQGNFRLTKSQNGETQISNGVPDASAYKIKSKEIGSFHGDALTLHELESRVQKAATQ